MGVTFSRGTYSRSAAARARGETPDAVSRLWAAWGAGAWAAAAGAAGAWDCCGSAGAPAEPGPKPEMSFEGTTYITPELIFGSINRECFWTQRRPLLGYWQSGEGERPAMFRMRFFKDGKDFSSAGVRMAQSKNRVVFALAMLTDRGDWHIGLDRPADNKFTFSFDGQEASEQNISCANVSIALSGNGSNNGASHEMLIAQRASETRSDYYAIPMRIESPFGFSGMTTIYTIKSASHTKA